LGLEEFHYNVKGRKNKNYFVQQVHDKMNARAMLAYARSPSVEQGSCLNLCVEPGHRFRVAFYRHSSQTLEPMGKASPSFDAFEGQGRGGPDQDWNWPSISFFIDPAIFPSGVYFAVVFEGDEPTGPLEHLTSDAAMFVVTPRSPSAAIAYIVPIATMQAYNFTGGGCFYEYPEPYAAPSRTVTLRRPGCGIGGESREAADPYDAASPRQAFLHWDAKLISFLTAHGYDIDCYTDLDLDRRQFLAGRHRLMISAGHHEYWSQPMRAHTREFLDSGGNLAIFSGNTCYRKISFDAQGASITKENEAWPDSNEAALTGLSYSRGGGWWGKRRAGVWYEMERCPIGYTVVDPGHWIFSGVPLPGDQTFGAPERLLGYECDGVVPGISPANLNVLAEAYLTGGWNNGDGHTAAMVIFQLGQGTVFNAGTTDWARLLADPASPSYAAVARITRNVVQKLSCTGCML